jgi:hypothetical protein
MVMYCCGVFPFPDINGCAEAGGDPCLGVANSNGTCIDQQAPNTGFTCACDAGRTWDGAVCAGG